MPTTGDFETWGQAFRNLRLLQNWTQADMAEALGISQPALSMIERDVTADPSDETLEALYKATGWRAYKRGDMVHVEREGARLRARSDAQPMGDDVIVPVLTQDVHAGEPLPVLDDNAEMFNVTRHYRDTVVVRVVGDSMTGAGIEDGDKLVVRAGPNWRDGMAVLAVVNGDYILKRAYREGDSIRFKPANPSYEDRVYPIGEVSVIGHVIEIIRRFR